MNNTSNLKTIQSILKKIEILDHTDYQSGYYIGKNTIQNIFCSLNENTLENINAKLTLIDSIFSTQMNKRYYGIEMLSKDLYYLSNNTEKSLKDLFLNLLKNINKVKDNKKDIDKILSAFNLDNENNLFLESMVLVKMVKKKDMLYL